VKPVVTASVGRVSFAPTKPTCSNEPEVGMMYISVVSLKVTVEELAVMVQGVVVESESVEKVMFVTTDVLKVGTCCPM